MLDRYCLALDLIDDAELIGAYEEWHRNVWPEILAGIRSSGIAHMEIYRVANRMFMIMEVNEQFDWAEKARADADSEIVQQWETLMWNYQQPLPFAKPGEKWMLMKKIFST
ncbi:MAG: hypothetical protein RLZZ28_188 [Bacteroidota bacterium]|jgi:L-rhamnose mutarotase